MKQNNLTICGSRGSHLFACGEKAVFTISGDGEIHWELTRDGAEVLHAEDALLQENHPLEIAGTLNEPGFLRCRAVYRNPEQNPSVLCGAGFDVTNIRPAVPEPEDFDRFWQNALEEDVRLAPEVRMEWVDELSDTAHTVYRVSTPTVGRNIYAWLSVPTGKGPFPGIVTVPGAGAGVNNPCSKWLRDNHLEDKVAMLVITVHPFPLPVRCASLADFIAEKYGPEGYFSSGLTERPEDFFFYRLIPGAIRMTRWFAGQSFVDSARIVYHGGSQGGFAGHFLTAFAPVFKAAQFFVPSAYSDVGGVAAGRHPAQSNRKNAAEYWRTLRYFDSANAARRIQCPVQVFIGFIDNICFPSATYAAYNSLTCEKNVINMVDAGHAGEAQYGPLGVAFLRSKLNLSDEWM